MSADFADLHAPSALDDVPDEEIAAALPTQPPASLFDIAYLYAILDTLARSATADGVDRSYIQYMTPGERPEVFDQSDADGDHAGNPNVLAARIVIEDGEARLADPAVITEQFSRDEVYRLGYATLARKTSHTTVYSATFHKSGSPEKVANALTDQLVKWPDKEGTIEACEQGYDDLLGPLRTLGNDDNAVQQLRKAAEECLTEDSIGEKGMMVTLSVQTDETDWRYPGEIEALNEAMARNRTQKLKDGKSAAKGMDAYGEGVCLVRNTETTVYGGTGTPMATSAGKQHGIFDDLHPGHAHHTRPLSREAAFALSVEGLVNEFRTKLGYGRHLYLLPYPATNSVDAARELYGAIETVRNSDDAPEIALGPTLTANARLSLYAYLLTFEQNSVRLPQFEASRIDKSFGSNLAEAHSRERANWLYTDERGPFAAREHWRNEETEWLFTKTGPSLLAGILRQQYFVGTIAQPVDDMDNPETFTELPQLALSFRLFEGDTIPARELFDEFASHCIDRQQTAFENDWNPVPNLAATQLLQLSALAAIGVVDGYEARTETTPNMTNRDTKLGSFIDARPALSNNNERQAAFLLGGLVGRLSAFQQQIETSNRLIQRYPIESLTERNFAEITAEVIGLNNTYSETESSGNRLMNARYTERLMDVGQYEATDNWTIDRGDLRYHYALGIAYGNADSRHRTDDDDTAHHDN